MPTYNPVFYTTANVTVPPGLSLLYKLVEAVSKGDYSDELLELALQASNTSVIQANLPPKAAFQKCHGCDRVAFSCNMHRAYGGKQYICNRCKPAYVYCKQCESLILADDTQLHVHAPQLTEFMELNTLNHYKANPVEHMKAQWLRADNEPKWKGYSCTQPRYFGIEIEVEKILGRPQPPDLIAKSVACFPKGTILAKTDGSLSKDPKNPMTNGSNGWELCSMPGTLAYHISERSGWLKFFSVMRPYLQARPETTGLHFHVSLSSVSPLTVGKVNVFVNRECNYGFLVSIADREFNTPSPTPPHKVYSKTAKLIDSGDMRHQLKHVHSMRKHEPMCPFNYQRKSTRMYYYDRHHGFTVDHQMCPIIIRIDADPQLTFKCRCKHGQYTFKDHYAALNLKTNKDTFEFRLFRFSMNPQHFFASLEFVDALICFCDQAAIDDLTTEKFLRWYEQGQRRQYPNLTMWLVERAWLKSLRRRD